MKLRKFGNPGQVQLKSGKVEDPQMGFGTPFARSSLPATGQYAAGRFQAQDSATGGSTVAGNFSTGFQNFRKQNSFRNTWGRMLQGQLGGIFGGVASSALGGGGGSSDPGFGSLFRSDRGSLAKYAEVMERTKPRLAAQFEESKHPRDASGKFTDTGGGPGLKQGAWGQGSGKDAKQLPGGPQSRLGSPLRGFISVARNKDAEFQGITPETGRWFKVKEQKPSSMSEAQYHDIARKAGHITRAQRDATIARATENKLIPEGTDPKHVKLAFAHARNTALRDFGLFDYDYGFSAEDRPVMMQMTPFIRYAKRRMDSELRGGLKGQWKPFRDEFGEPFPKAKFYTQGAYAGQERKRFKPLPLVKVRL